MRSALRKLARGALWALVVIGVGFFLVLPRVADWRVNRARPDRPLRPPSPRALALHARLRIVDLHCDALLWDRDLLSDNRRGQVDLPRLQRGNVALQVMSAVTRVPYPLSLEGNRDRPDAVLLVALSERWPPSTWTSLTARALYQAEKLHRFAAASGGRWVVLRGAADLDDFLRRRAADPSLTASLLSIEGAQALDGDVDNLERLYQAGYRMISPSHFFDTEIGGSAHGVGRGGLTDKGRDWLARMEARRMLVDLAHASPRTIEEVARRAHRPLWVSHTGVRATCDSPRNLSDEQLRLIARSGGVVGIGFWPRAVCGSDPRAIAIAVRHAVSVIGARHVALGSDFDGKVQTPFDSAGLVALTDALLAAGLSEGDVALVMGDSALRLLRETLP